MKNVPATPSRMALAATPPLVFHGLPTVQPGSSGTVPETARNASSPAQTAGTSEPTASPAPLEC